MILSLHAQASLFLLTILMGGCMGLLYDGLRVFRHALHHKPFWVQLEDGLFWLLAVFLVFSVMLGKVGRFCGKQRKKLLQSCKLCVKMIVHHIRLDWRILRRK